MKHCSKCSTWSKETNFTKNSKALNGLSSWCKLCTRKNSNDGYRKNRQKVIDRTKKYQQTEKGKIVVKKAYNKWKNSNLKKFLAHQSILSMTRRGLIKPKLCEICNSERVHAHHNDYDRPYDVVWLCPQHHKDKHKLIT